MPSVSPASMPRRKAIRFIPLILTAGLLLIGLWLYVFRQASELPVEVEGRSRQSLENARPSDRSTAYSPSVDEPTSLPSSIDLSPPPGAITQRPSSDWPFSAPWQDKSGSAGSLQETTRALGRANSAKALAASATVPTPHVTATATASAASTDFEAPPGLGSPRGAR